MCVRNSNNVSRERARKRICVYRSKERDGKDDRRDVRATAFNAEGRENIGGDLVIITIASDSCHLDYNKCIRI